MAPKTRREPDPDYGSMAEEDLVAHARNGARGAFAAIIQRYNQRLFRLARGIVSDDTEAEDVVQESYCRGFAALSSFRGDASLLTWLSRIAINEARGRLRRRRHTVELSEIEIAQVNNSLVIPFKPDQSLRNPESDAARAQIRALIERAVDDLPDGFRLVFILRDVQECSIEETAELLGLKPETVKTRLHRARHQLRSALERDLHSAVHEAFPFLGARCERISQRVLARLAGLYGWESREGRDAT